nr:translation initiation factor IF-2-like [Chlorocebus sabaeus]
MRAPAVPNFPNPHPGVTGFASSQPQATSSQTGYEAASPVPVPSPPPEKAAEGRGAVRADTAGARVPAPRVRAAGAARPHLPCKDPATHPNDVPLRPSSRHRRLFRPLRTPLFATAPFAAAVAAVLAAAPAAAARVRFHALSRGRARATARWRHLATGRPRAAGSRGAGLESRLRRPWRLFRTGSTRCPSRAGGPRVWLPCRHLAPGATPVWWFSQCGPGPAASASLKNLLEMQVSAKSETLKRRSSESCLLNQKLLG